MKKTYSMISYINNIKTQNYELISEHYEIK